MLGNTESVILGGEGGGRRTNAGLGAKSVGKLWEILKVHLFGWGWAARGLGASGCVGWGGVRRTW